MWLVKNGVPFDIANNLWPHEALAWSVIFGEFEGAAFDWNALEWVRRD